MESRLADIKTYGIVALIIGIAGLILGVYGEFDADRGAARMAIAAIPGIIMIIVGYLAYTGYTKNKMEALYTFLLLMGLSMIISGILLFGDDTVLSTIWIAIGLLAMFIGYRLYLDVRQSIIWWVILLIVFIILAISNFSSLLGSDFGDVGGIAYAIGRFLYVILYVFLIYFLFSADVKNKFA